MIDLFALYKAFKISWVQRYISEEICHPWKSVVNFYLNPIGGQLIFRCNYKVDRLPVKLPSYYREMLQCWSEVNPCSHFPIVQQIIWNNSDILVNNKSVFINFFYQRGILYISDMFNEYNTLKSWDDLSRIGCTASLYLRWQGLLHALPHLWKGQSSEMVRPELPICFINENKIIYLNTCNVKTIRKRITSDYFIPPKCKLFFSQFLDISEEEWSVIFNLPFKVTMETKLQEFQWKITHNILYTNTVLFRMNPPRVNSNQCTFCKKADETIVHLFVDCEFSQNIWNNLLLNFGEAVNAPSVISPKQILLGDVSFSNLLNHLIIIVKKTIYDCKLKEKIPTFEHFKANVKIAKQVEFYIAKRNQCTRKALLKWQNIEF